LRTSWPRYPEAVVDGATNAPQLLNLRPLHSSATNHRVKYVIEVIALAKTLQHMFLLPMLIVVLAQALLLFMLLLRHVNAAEIDTLQV
jgi:hypothetical protein